MGAAIYLVAAVFGLLVLGWIMYVLPTPGPLSPLQLAIALIPAVAILLGLLASMAALWFLARGIGYAQRIIGRAILRRRQPPNSH